MALASNTLRVGVVGGGIAGLAASAALRRQGHKVEIFEASSTNEELGFGVTIPPNGIKALEALGCPKENILPINWKQAVFVPQGDKPSDFFDMQYYPSVFGQDWVVCARRALHSELKRLAFGNDNTSSPCTIHLSSSVVSCDPEQGIITMKDGQNLEFDLVIGADGLRSCMRTSIDPHAPTPSPTGISVFRFTAQRTLLENIPSLKWLLSEGLAGPRILLAGGSRNIFMYLINCPERGEVFNFTVMCEDARDQSTAKWRVDVPREMMLDLFRDFDPRWKELLNLAPPIVSLWQLRALEPIPTWSRGRACVLGDAAHAMFQSTTFLIIRFRALYTIAEHDSSVLGQGAAQTLEDALLFGTLLPFETSRCEIPEILKRFEKIRQPRVHLIQSMSIEQMQSPVKNSEYMRSPHLPSPDVWPSYRTSDAPRLHVCSEASLLLSGSARLNLTLPGILCRFIGSSSCLANSVFDAWCPASPGALLCRAFSSFAPDLSPPQPISSASLIPDWGHVWQTDSGPISWYEGMIVGRLIFAYSEPPLLPVEAVTVYVAPPTTLDLDPLWSESISTIQKLESSSPAAESATPFASAVRVGLDQTVIGMVVTPETVIEGDLSACFRIYFDMYQAPSRSSSDGPSSHVCVGMLLRAVPLR
ncbi:hypothetical protein NP233_g5550 [Leucocoprinus birnbaumii]|uniref:FAD-binding domain-containing protein n=1 Tax=Leucocoprinus birnbaumii TaxID=56174 RepID=A0AAD5VUZ9_9AGAR|nr:hypothetical protein NP233_g5550 [Leucocoprinus birnbaumii]